MRQLKGTGANAGSGPVEGVAVVAHSAQEARERLQSLGGGRPVVLVCATFSLEHEFGLLRGVRGMVTEDSPLLPTAMTVARELGLPVVAGLGATIDTIRDGQAVFVDGGAGTVEIIG